MYCQNCGTELEDTATFCSNCGNKVARSRKNIYLALILTFFITGLGSVYAGDTKKGIALLIIRVVLAVLGVFVNFLFVMSVLVWAYAFYEAYKDVQIANGHRNPNLASDFKTWNRDQKIIAVLIIGIIMIFTVSGCISPFMVPEYSYDDSGSHYYVSDDGSSSGSSSYSSHYGGVDDSPHTIAKNDPDWYYDHYDYGDYDEIDEYMESQGYD